MINATTRHMPANLRLSTLTFIDARRRAILGLLISLCLSACSSLPQQATTASSFAANNEIQHWQLRGKIGLRNEKQAHSAYINWTQCGERFDIRITGPLGQGAAHLFGNQQQVSLETSNQQIFHADSAEQLLAQHMGWSFPVEQLFYWLRGIPAPDQTFQPLDQDDNAPLIGFQQSQWQLHYPTATPVDHYLLPTKIIAEHSPMKVTLLIKQWLLQPDCSRVFTAA